MDSSSGSGFYSQHSHQAQSLTRDNHGPYDVSVDMGGAHFRVTVLSAIAVAGLFSCMSYFYGKMTNKHWFPPLAQDKSDAKMYAHKWWRRKNLLTSVSHSVVSGICALATFFVYPEMCTDMVYAASHFNHYLMVLSVGYFMFDAQDLIRHELTLRTAELLFHHFICVSTFFIGLSARRFYAFGAVALLMEVNSIFLHTRTLLGFHGVSKDSRFYRITSLLCVGTFLVFRLLVLGWMTRWVLKQYGRLPMFFFLVGSIGLAIMTIVNLGLFYRILVADNFLARSQIHREFSGSSIQPLKISSSKMLQSSDSVANHTHNGSAPIGTTRAGLMAGELGTTLKIRNSASTKDTL